MESFRKSEELETDQEKDGKKNTVKTVGTSHCMQSDPFKGRSACSGMFPQDEKRV
jgi:hypothetical protein